MEKIHLVLFLAFWSASFISQTQACSTPPVVDNAFISENEKIGNYSEGDIVYYTCHPGYISRGRLRYKCQDGEWTQSRLLKCTPKPCEHPGDIINGHFHLVNNTEFLYGVQVKYTCNEGYQMASQMDFRVCLDNGWSNDVPHCEVKTCIPQKPEAGIIITSGKFESDEPIPYGNVLKFECSSSDFIIDGESEVHCKADGNWSSPFPTCKELKCPSPPNILHGRLVQASENEYAHDQRVKYQCDQFYQIQGSTFIRCIHGTWSIPPSCIETCGVPPVVNNAVIIHGKKTFYDNNDQVVYQCKKGYKFQGPYNYKYSRCLHGKWSIIPECLSSTCGPPPAVDNAEIAQGRRREYEDNDWIGYRCHQGYGFEGSIYYSTCLHGKWSDAPKCISLRPTCGPPPAVDNAEITHGERREYEDNDWIRYRCHQGYGFEGSIYYSVCQHGKWSNAPKCISLRPTCGPPPAVNNAVILRGERREYKDNEVIEYRCNLGYEFEGSNDYSTCQHGKWSDAPKCIRSGSGSGSECGPPPVVDNAVIEQRPKTSGVYQNGDTMAYQCQSFYVLKGSNQARCNRGTWESLPICLEPCTVNDNDMEQRNIMLVRTTSTNFIKHNDIIVFMCKYGTRLSPGSGPFGIHCNNGQLDLPICN